MPRRTLAQKESARQMGKMRKLKETSNLPSPLRAILRSREKYRHTRHVIISTLDCVNRNSKISVFLLELTEE